MPRTIEDSYPVCPYCKSDQVLLDAYAEWDNGHLMWTLACTFEEYVCNSCGEHFNEPNWIPNNMESN